MGLVISAKKDQIFPFLLIAPKDIKAHLTITERANYDGGAIDLSWRKSPPIFAIFNDLIFVSFYMQMGNHVIEFALLEKMRQYGSGM